MNMTQVNALERYLEKFKDQKEYLAEGCEAEFTQAFENISNLITTIETEIANLRINKNSLSGKVLLWFREHAAANPELHEAFSLKAGETNITITVDCAKAFNLNLAENPNFDWDSEADWQEFEEFQNREDCLRAEEIMNDDHFSVGEFLDDNHFDGLLSHSKTSVDFTYFEMTFKTSKKLLKDEETMNQIFTTLVNRINDKCKEFRKV